MPFPFAAVAAAVATAALQAQRDRQNSNSGGGGAGVGKLIVGGSAVRASTMNALTGSASGLVDLGPVDRNSRTRLEGVGQAINRVLGGTGGTPTRGLVGGSIPGAGGVTVTGFRRRYRRTNLGNIKALRRAGRRLTGFVKLAKSMVALEQRARVKRPRRRR